jgi:crotonobetainyl-CoA:carnitine CoA-transferase CaiB-like acyl-CoA transferase
MGPENRMLPVEAGQKTVRLPALPFESDEFQFSVRRQPPRLGEHSREILQELGLSDSDMDRLVRNKVVMMA